MWKFQKSDLYDRKEKWFVKKHPSILKTLFVNLANAQGILISGKNPQNLAKHAKIRSEGYQGLFAIDQRGASQREREARLYIFVEELTHTIHLLTIGFKDTQHDDRQISIKYIENFKKEFIDG